MLGIEYERMLVEVIIDLAEKKGVGHKPLALKAWPSKNGADVSWRATRNNSRRLNIGEAYDLAVALGISFVELAGLAQARLMQKCSVPIRFVDSDATLAVQNNPENLSQNFGRFAGK